MDFSEVWFFTIKKSRNNNYQICLAFLAHLSDKLDLFGKWHFLDIL